MAWRRVAKDKHGGIKRWRISEKYQRKQA